MEEEKKYTHIQRIVTDEDERLCHPVSVVLNRVDFQRWMDLKYKLKKMNKHVKLSDFARKSMVDMMDKIEERLEELELDKSGSGSLD